MWLEESKLSHLGDSVFMSGSERRHKRIQFRSSHHSEEDSSYTRFLSMVWHWDHLRCPGAKQGFSNFSESKKKKDQGKNWHSGNFLFIIKCSYSKERFSRTQRSPYHRHLPSAWQPLLALLCMHCHGYWDQLGVLPGLLLETSYLGDALTDDIFQLVLNHCYSTSFRQVSSGPYWSWLCFQIPGLNVLILPAKKSDGKMTSQTSIQVPVQSRSKGLQQQILYDSSTASCVRNTELKPGMVVQYLGGRDSGRWLRNFKVILDLLRRH